MQAMTDEPWSSDASSLVDAFRAGDRSPVEELDATLVAIERSELNAFAHLDPDRARVAAKAADLSKPFGGVPTGIKELEPVELVARTVKLADPKVAQRMKHDYLNAIGCSIPLFPPDQI